MLLTKITILFILTSISAYADQCNTKLIDDIPKEILRESIRTNIFMEPRSCRDHDDCIQIYELYESNIKSIKMLYPKMEKLATNGNVYALLNMGMYRFYSDDPDKYFKGTEDYWKTAAENEFPLAHYALGILYHFKGDKIKSTKHLKIAAELGHADAMLILALHHYHGRAGIDKDMDKFFILAMQANMLGSSLFNDTKIIYPFPCDDISPIKLDLTHILQNMIGNEGWYTDKARQKRIRQLLIGYDKKSFDGIPSIFPYSDMVHNIPTMTTYGLIEASAILKAMLGNQGFINKLSSQPDIKAINNLQYMYDGVPDERFNKYLIYSKKLTTKKSKGNVRVLSELEIWDILSPMDLLLLSDGITHHYISVFKVNRSNNTILLIDSWPHESFLQENKNENNVKAILVDSKYNRKIQQITKEELFKVLIGTVITRIK